MLRGETDDYDAAVSPDAVREAFQLMFMEDERAGDVVDAVDVRSAQDRCQYCGGSEIVLEEGNFMCTTCHCLVRRYIDTTAEWRSSLISSNHDGSMVGGESGSRAACRCGPPVNDLIPTIGASMGRGRSSGGGKRTSESRRRKGADASASPSTTTQSMSTSALASKKLQRYHSWNTLSHRDRKLCAAFDAISTLAVHKGFPASVIEHAKSLYKHMTDAKLVRGEARASLGACCMFLACKACGAPRSLREISELLNVKSTSITKGCKAIYATLDIPDATSSASDFVGRFCSKLQLSEDIVALCRHIVKRAQDLGIAQDCIPPSLVAGTLLLCNDVAGLGLTRSAIETACQTSQVTIVKCYRRLVASVGILL